MGAVPFVTSLAASMESNSDDDVSPCGRFNAERQTRIDQANCDLSGRNTRASFVMLSFCRPDLHFARGFGRVQLVITLRAERFARGVIKI